MEDVYDGLVDLEYPILSNPPALSPAVDDLEIQRIHKTLKSAKNDFCVLMNINLFESKEIEIKVLKNRLIEIRAKHGKRQMLNALCMTRDFTHTYKIPERAFEKKLHAQWWEDGYLSITTSSNSDNYVEEDILLVPEKTQRKLLPVVDMAQVKGSTENSRDIAQNILKYIHFHTFNRPIHFEGIQAIVYPEKLDVHSGGNDWKPSDSLSGGNDGKPRDSLSGGNDGKPRDSLSGGNDGKPRDASSGGNDGKPRDASSGGNDGKPRDSPSGGNDGKPRDSPSGGNDRKPRDSPSGGNKVKPRYALSGRNDLNLVRLPSEIIGNLMRLPSKTIGSLMRLPSKTIGSLMRLPSETIGNLMLLPSETIENLMRLPSETIRILLMPLPEGKIRNFLMHLPEEMIRMFRSFEIYLPERIPRMLRQILDLVRDPITSKEGRGPDSSRIDGMFIQKAN